MHGVLAHVLQHFPFSIVSVFRALVSLLGPIGPASSIAASSNGDRDADRSRDVGPDQAGAGAAYAPNPSGSGSLSGSGQGQGLVRISLGGILSRCGCGCGRCAMRVLRKARAHFELESSGPSGP